MGRLSGLVDEQPAQRFPAQVTEQPGVGGEGGGDDGYDEEQALPRGERRVLGDVAGGLAVQHVHRRLQVLA